MVGDDVVEFKREQSVGVLVGTVVVADDAVGEG